MYLSWNIKFDRIKIIQLKLLLSKESHWRSTASDSWKKLNLLLIVLIFSCHWLHQLIYICDNKILLCVEHFVSNLHVRYNESCWSKRKIIIRYIYIFIKISPTRKLDLTQWNYPEKNNYFAQLLFVILLQTIETWKNVYIFDTNTKKKFVVRDKERYRERTKSTWYLENRRNDCGPHNVNNTSPWLRQENLLSKLCISAVASDIMKRRWMYFRESISQIRTIGSICLHRGKLDPVNN